MAKVLSAGVDTLIINAKRADDLQPEDGETDDHDPVEQLSEEMVEQLERWQSVAKYGGPVCQVQKSVVGKIPLSPFQ